MHLHVFYLDCTNVNASKVAMQAAVQIKKAYLLCSISM